MSKIPIQKTQHGIKNFYPKNSLYLRKGITALVGCNGIGKSTLLQLIRNHAEYNNITVISYDDEHNGGSMSLNKHMFSGDVHIAATLFSSSEGEKIMVNMNTLAKKIANIVKEKRTSEVWIILDAITSGMSIDAIRMLKGFFDAILEDANEHKQDVRIIVATNEYEMCRDVNCLDCTTFEYVTFDGYSDYANFIMDTSRIKDSRYEKEEQD